MVSDKQGLIKPYSAFFGPALRIIDVFIICGLFVLVAFIHSVTWHSYFTLATFLSVLFYSLIAEFSELYGSWRFSSIRQEIQKVLLICLGTIFILLALAYATKTSAIYSRRVLLSLMVLIPLCLSAFRILLRQFLHSARQRNRNMKNAVIVGAEEQGIHVFNEIHRLKWTGLKLLGYFDDNLAVGSQPDRDHPEAVIGDNSELVKYVNERSVDMVFISLPMQQASKIEALVKDLADTTVQTYIVPDLFISNLLQTRWGYIGDVPILSVYDRPFSSLDGLIKRTEDIVLSALIMCVIVIPMLIIAIIIKCTSSGPILFKQKRYGISGQKIDVWKFRSMTVCEDGNEIKQAQKNDVRVTPFGQFLRKTSMDELPQFINVLQGTMSIVGPRPHAVAHNELYRKQVYGYMLRHTIKPGITGWAQVNGWRGETETLDKMEGRIEHDLWYIKNWSLWLDLKIIVLTIPSIFTGKQAY